jgi:hypothetical protein
MEPLNKILAVPLVSVLVGAGVTWLVAWWYYSRAGAELREESKKLRQATDLVIYCLTNKDARVTANYDANGNVSGLTVNASGVAHLSMQAQGTLTK